MSAAVAPVTRLLRIRGQVQGVGYRAAMVAQAHALAVRGWVRNRGDGSVEALLQGAPDPVQALIDWADCGPPAARVQAVDVQDVAAPEEAAAAPATGFEQRPTA